MEIDEIKAIVELMSKHNLSEFKVEADNMHLCLKREPSLMVSQQPQQSYVLQPNMGFQQQPAINHIAQENNSSPSPKVTETVKNTINAPIVGTFYNSAGPDAPNFVKVGDRVEPDTVVCIIEAMKVMNEIKAEKSGVVKEILVQNAQSVEYGCPLFVIG